MKTIDKNSKLGKCYLYAYEHSNMQNIYDAYKKPSSAKIQADKNCQRQCYVENGYAYRIISASHFIFTVAWQTAQGLRIETAYNSYIIK